MLTKPSSPQALWTPNATRAAQSHIQRFINELVADKPALNISDYQQLHQWTLDNPEHFWERVWDFCGVVGSKQGQTTLLGEAVWSDVVPARDTVWFPEAKLNYAENLLDYGAKNPEKVAILFQNEQGHVEQYTWKILLEHVSIMQQWLQSINVAEGDVVAGYLPHSPYAVIAMLAATSLGAIWTSTSPDFGAESVIERFGQVKPKVLFCVDGYQFGGKSFTMQIKTAPSQMQLNLLHTFALWDTSTSVRTNHQCRLLLKLIPTTLSTLNGSPSLVNFKVNLFIFNVLRLTLRCSYSILPEQRESLSALFTPLAASP